ncbi:hypothetical protein EJB05_31886, partial [Eragrostis curvula]
MANFTAFLRETYALPPAATVNLARYTLDMDRKPRLLLIYRGRYRRLVNEQEVAEAAATAGFEAVVMELRGDTPVGDQARLVNSFDVLMGLHGTGLFLQPGGVLIQVVPYGKMEFIARAEFSEPAADMGLKSMLLSHYDAVNATILWPSPTKKPEVVGDLTASPLHNLTCHDSRTNVTPNLLPGIKSNKNIPNNLQWSNLHPKVSSSGSTKQAAMCCSEVKPVRSLTSWRHLHPGFVVAGVLLVVLTYLVVSQQFAVSARYVVITKAQWTTDEQLVRAPGDVEKAEKQGKVTCSSEGYFSESCQVDGDVRINGQPCR